jgi:hypothetical protein
MKNPPLNKAQQPGLITLKQFAARNGLSNRAGFRLLRAGRLAVTNIGGQVLVSPEQEAAWRNSNKL